MEIFTIENLTFTYPNRSLSALNNLNFSITTGEFVVICGQSGSGKSTLLKNMKPVLTPNGVKTGQILYYGKKIEDKKIGYVFQNPDNQIVTERVWQELAFGLENMGLETKTIRLRVAEMASFFGIQNWFDKEVNDLSGGQKQLLNLAAIMVMQPDVLLLDEPTSQLDPIAAADFLETVKKINKELGTTVIMTEHRLENVFPMADKVIVLEKGSILSCNTPSQIGTALAQKNHPMFFAMPAPLQAYIALSQQKIGSHLKCPMDVREGRNWLTELLKEKNVVKTELPEKIFFKKDVVLKMKNVWFKYNRQGNDIIKDLSLEVYQGELFCLMGGNGTGKTTTLSVAAGLQKPYRGTIKTKGKWAMLPQNPQNLFVEKTVKEDLLEQQQKIEEIEDIIELVNIESLLEMHPYDLSGGEQQRVALAKVLLLKPDILYLDEPTKCLDNEFKIKLGNLLKELTAKGVTILMVSHDVEFCGKYADRCAMFFDGKIVAIDTPRHFFSGNNFYTTAANRMSRHVFKNAIDAEDIVELVKENYGIASKDDIPPKDNISPKEKQEKKEQKKEEPLKPYQNKKKKKTFLLEISILLVTALTIYIGLFVFEKKHYILTNLFLIFYAMIPFFYQFEKRKPKAREIVLLAVMVALATVGRAAFFMVPNFKPTVAIVILAGICLGKESGFLIGSMSAFVSNFLFGQGPWTPYQMIATAIIGYFAGILFYHRHVSVWIVALFGGIATFFIYGGIVDLWTIFYMNSEPTLASALVVYSAAIYFNTVHAMATMLFLLLLTKPMMEKINRVKIKYLEATPAQQREK